MKRARQILSAIAAALFALAAIGCGPDATTKAPQESALPEGAMARVGARVIFAESVARIAAAQGLDARAARDLAIRDALFADEAETSGLVEKADVQQAVRGALARRALRALRAEAARAPITDEELARATERRWLEVARPEAFRTAHAVVRFDAGVAEEKRKSALALAEAIRAAVLPLRDRAAELPAPDRGDPSDAWKRPEPEDPLAKAFERAASAVAHEGFEVIIQPLPPVTADGRALTPDGQRFDPDFARAAAALSRRGEVSPIATSAFGAHVIVLLEKVPPAQLEEAERRRVLGDDIITERARAAQKKLLDAAREGSHVALDADALLALVAVDR